MAMKAAYLLLLLTVIPFVSSYDWKIGGLAYGAFGSNYTAADDPYLMAQYLNLAILYINNYTTLLTPYNVTMSMVYFNTAGGTTEGVIRAFQLAETYDVRGVSGGIFSSEVIAEAQVLQYFEVPQCSSMASTSTLSDKSLYPYFFRTGPVDIAETLSTLVTLHEIGYTQAVILYSADDYGIGCRSSFQSYAANYSITSTAISIPSSASTAADYASILAQVNATNINAIVIYSQVTQGNGLIVQANASGMIGSRFTYFLCSTLTNQYQTHVSGYADPSLLDGMVGVASASGSGEVYEEVWALWNSLDPTVWLGAGTYVDPGFPAWYTFDSMYVFAVGLSNLLAEGYAVGDITNSQYKEALFSLDMIGTTNQVIFDSNGDRLAYYDIVNWRNKGTNYTKVGLVNPQLTYTKVMDIEFYGGTTTAPDNVNFVCKCLNGGYCNSDKVCVCPANYRGDYCDTNYDSDKTDVTTLVIAIVVPVVVVVACILLGVYYFYRKKRAVLIQSVADKQRSEIPRADILLGERIGRGASGEVYKGQLRGTDVAIKKFIASAMSKDITETFMLETSMMCGLRHPNVVLFMGSCYELKTKEMFLVMEFMARGSLYDVLHKPKVHLSYELRISLALQSAQGINFLHQATPPILHRDIKSHNILLDDKWTARISDFGITVASDTEDKTLGTLYWTANEVLNGSRHTEKSDVYSFGIVLYELMHNTDPYPGRDTISVASQVMLYNLRPTIDPTRCPIEMQDLMQACWHQSPEQRPTFKEIVAKLKQMNESSPILPSTLMQDNVSAPTGTVFLVKTDVENALHLWDVAPRAMETAMVIHNDTLRSILERNKGYESSYEDHSFLISFGVLDNAIGFCKDLINTFERMKWPTPLNAKQDGSPSFKTRLALNMGAPNCHITQNEGNLHYFGPVVEKTSKILESVKSGQILVSESVRGELLVKDFGVQLFPASNGCYELKVGNDNYVTPYDEEGPIGMVSLTSYDEKNAESADIKWLIDVSDVVKREDMGVGPIGEISKVSYGYEEMVMKMLAYQKMTEPDAFSFIAHASIMSKIKHPNLMKFYGVCNKQRNICIFEEYLERGSLFNMLANTSIELSWERKLQFAHDIASGMHALSMIEDTDISKHRGLKSPNCMIGKNWEVKVADFGLHKIKDALQTVTASINVAWSAPELYNDASSFSPATPIYSFGIILWEILTRKVPFAGTHPTRLVSMILSGHRPEIPATCLPAYRSLIEQCWDAEPSKRPTWSQILSEIYYMQGHTKVQIS